MVMFETLFIFLLLSNLIGIIPGFVSPTQVIYVPAGCALIAFLYFNYCRDSEARNREVCGALRRARSGGWRR